MSTPFDKSFEHLRGELSSLHTGRANPGMLENIEIEAYGSKMSLQELASISSPEPQQLLIMPWDKSVVKDIESGLRASDLNLNPVVDGESIRINFPPLTEEKRQELVKIMHTKLEDARISVRKIREELIKELKESEKNGDLSEDEYFREEKEVQTRVDNVNVKIKGLGEKKEQELMTV